MSIDFSWKCEPIDFLLQITKLKWIKPTFDELIKAFDSNLNAWCFYSLLFPINVRSVDFVWDRRILKSGIYKADCTVQYSKHSKYSIDCTVQ